MTLEEQVYAQALVLAGSLEEERKPLLMALCTAATGILSAQLREGLTPEDCKADFVAAASLLALANFNGACQGEPSEFRVGEVTLKRDTQSRDTASNCLRHQAELMISPYLKDRFAFLGV